MSESKKQQDLEQRVKTLERLLEKEQERRVRFKPIADLEDRIASLETDLNRERLRRKRVVAAYLALRDLKLPDTNQPRTITLTKYIQASQDLQGSDLT